MPRHASRWACALGLSAATTLAAAAPAPAASTDATGKPKPKAKKAAPKTYAITQHNLNFDPDVLKINPGDKVVWTNKESDDTIHSVVQMDGSEINSPDIPPTTSFEVTFTEPFEWRFKCRFHPDMFMNIAVAGEVADGDGLHAEPSPREEPKPAKDPLLPGLPPVGDRRH